MRTLYLERSVSSGRNGAWVNELDLKDVGRIVVGLGPGSFAGIRSALAFAQGFALGCACEVLGLPSPCALAEEGVRRAVLGDARRGFIWVALLDGFKLLEAVFQVQAAELAARIPKDFEVVSPDDARIGALLKDSFGERYKGLREPTAEGLERYALEDSAALVSDPRPIYLNPAVR